jgi:predicted DCC family thiol-disulfide oxidoreductase YuxK
VAALVYDGACDFCRREAQRLARLAAGALELHSVHDPGVLERFPEIGPEEARRELKFVGADRRVVGGVGAVAAALALSPAWGWVAALLRAPGLRTVADLGYRIIARNRYRLPGAACGDGTCPRHGEAGPSEPGAADEPAAAGDYRPTAQVFLRALGVVYLIVFGSLAVQVPVLIGSEGLLPVREFLAAQAGAGPFRFLRVPTLFWLWDGDLAVRGGTILGLGLAVALVLGWRPKTCLLLLWALFLSYVTAGRDFFWFQWDNLLLETTALALLLPSSPAMPPHSWVIFLFQWLLFRVHFESGLAKVQAGAQSWAPLMAMAWYYETAPLPSVGSWYAHQLPLWGHRVAAALTLLGELLGPLLFWGPRWARRLAFAGVVGFQLAIQATANYGYFNILTIVLALFLLDARDLDGLRRRLGRWWPGRRAAEPDPVPPRPRGRWLVGAAAAVIFALTLLELLVLLAAPAVEASPFWRGVRAAYQPYRIANKYHLFAAITPYRVEAELEWTADGERWSSYRFRYKPGDPATPPPVVAPHQPRVDFQLWFFTLGRDGGHHPYFDMLVLRLCRNPDSVRGLFVAESMPPAPPQMIRVAYFRYRMTDVATRDRDGAWWHRELVEYHPRAYFCDATEPPRF